MHTGSAVSSAVAAVPVSLGLGDVGDWNSPNCVECVAEEEGAQLGTRGLRGILDCEDCIEGDVGGTRAGKANKSGGKLVAYVSSMTDNTWVKYKTIFGSSWSLDGLQLREKYCPEINCIHTYYVSETAETHIDTKGSIKDSKLLLNKHSRTANSIDEQIFKKAQKCFTGLIITQDESNILSKY
uniref:Uncharacterized protein n=1 Tax=Glossina pallidipes TaxID=7398 RepID=A0A1A9ZWP8_GLOPL